MSKLERDWRNRIEKKIIANYVQGDVLDLGCGDGRLALELWYESTDYTGIDISKENIEKAQRLYPQIQLDFKVMDAQHLQFGDESFDTVFCGFNVIDEIPEISWAIFQIYRILKPQGYFIFSSHNPYYFKHLLKKYPDNAGKMVPKHRTHKDIMALCKKFTLIKKYGSVLSPYPYYVFQKKGGRVWDLSKI